MGVMASGDLHRNRVGILRMRSHLRPQRETRLPEPHALVRLSATLYRAGGAVTDEQVRRIVDKIPDFRVWFIALACMGTCIEATNIRHEVERIAPRDAAKGEG